MSLWGDILGPSPHPSWLERLRANGPSAWKVAIVGLLVVEAMTAAFLYWRGEHPSGAPGSATGGPVSVPEASGRGEVNPAGGFAFDPPRRWRVTTQGTTSIATSRDGGSVVTFGVSPLPAERASRRVVRLLRAGYSDVAVAEVRSDVDSAEAQAWATNDVGTRLEMKATARRQGGRTLVAVAFSDSDLDLKRAVLETAESLRPL